MVPHSHIPSSNFLTFTCSLIITLTHSPILIFSHLSHILKFPNPPTLFLSFSHLSNILRFPHSFTLTSQHYHRNSFSHILLFSHPFHKILITTFSHTHTHSHSYIVTFFTSSDTLILTISSISSIPSRLFTSSVSSTFNWSCYLLSYPSHPSHLSFLVHHIHHIFLCHSLFQLKHLILLIHPIHVSLPAYTFH